MKGKSYKVATFAELRAAFEKAKADAEKKKQEMKPEDKQQVEDTAKQYEFEADVKETGQKKNLAGYDTREVILTITAHEKGKKVEESGGFIMTTDMWLAPKIAALDELIAVPAQIHEGRLRRGVRRRHAADGEHRRDVSDVPADDRQDAGRERQAAGHARALDDDVRRRQERRGDERSDQNQNQPPPTTGGGIGGMLAKKMIGPKGEVTQRGTVFTSSHEILSVSPTVAAEDVAMPAGFKEKK